MKKTALMTLIGLAVLVLAPVAQAEDVAALYKAKCAACHGQDGKGDTTMGKKQGIRDLSSADVQKQTDAELTKIVAEGKDGKASHAYKKKGLTDEQVKGLVGFIRGLKK